MQYDAVALREDTPRPFEAALFVRTTVVSTNVGGQVTTDGGLKRFASDGPPPEIASGAPDGARYEFKGDEHGRVVFAKDGDGLPLGAAVECLTPHCDPTVNLYDYYYPHRDGKVEELWPISGRGKSQ